MSEVPLYHWHCFSSSSAADILTYFDKSADGKVTIGSSGRFFTKGVHDLKRIRVESSGFRPYTLHPSPIKPSTLNINEFQI